jgi:MFS family permease
MEIRAWWCKLCSILLHNSLRISDQDKSFAMEHDVSQVFFFLLRKIGYESAYYALCHVILWQASLFPLAQCCSSVVWGIISDRTGRKVCIYTCALQPIEHMLALKEIQHFLRGEKQIRTPLVQGFVCNSWFLQNWKTGSNECGPRGNSGVGAMGHACSRPWRLGAQRAP